MQDQTQQQSEYDDEPLTLKEKIWNFLDDGRVVAFTTFITIYALFADDVRQLIPYVEVDDAFNWLTIFCIIVFTVEVILASYSQDGYFNGFFFWLDVISTGSLFFDIGWLFNDILHDTGAEAAQLARAGRASRIGTKAGRIIRVIRLVRLVKVYKLAQQKLLEQKDDDDQVDGTTGKKSFKRKTTSYNKNKIKKGKSTIARQQQEEKNIENEIEEQLPEETQVGKQLSDLTTKRLVIIVLTILFSVPMFQIGTWYDDYVAQESGLKTIYLFCETNCDVNSNNALKTTIDTYVAANTDPEDSRHLVLLELWDPTSNSMVAKYQHGSVAVKDLRVTEQQVYYYINNDKKTRAKAVINKQTDTQGDAWFGIVRTIFVCIILTVGAMLFNSDTQTYVITPLENMHTKIKKITLNPLSAAQMQEDAGLEQELLFQKLKELRDKNQQKSKEFETISDQIKLQEQQKNFETSILEQTILKIGALLAIGFGDAGSDIIAKNMQLSGSINPMIPGKKLIAIFGFCDIRNFTDATEILQEDVMVFVNEIAEITHGTVDFLNGAANKNIGDAFLIVYKFPDQYIKSDGKDGLVLEKCNVVSQFADMAVVSFLKIMSRIYLSKTLKKYQAHAGLNQRMPNYRVKMGYGLHVGWAIEGALGSEFKIDATYLSPNVNMASTLEGVTKQYGTPLLISGSMYNVCTPDVQKQLRLVDKVIVQGTVDLLELYTIDVDFENLGQKIKISSFDQQYHENLSKSDKKKLNFRIRFKRNQLREKVLENKISVANYFFQTDKEIKAMRETWSDGVEYYLSGKWPEAIEVLNTTLNMRQGVPDGPSQTLLEVMKETGGQAPGNWKGYREISG